MILGPNGAVVRVISPDTPVILPAPETGVHIVLPIAGPKGDDGRDGGAPYVHTQVTPAATWTIPHTLGWNPEFQLFLDDAPAVRVYTDSSYPDLDTLVLVFPTPVSGIAYVR